jgi:bis(5'-nucleosidyl)-tetraphosphatase
MARFYAFEGIENFRDLGGYECDYGETQFGVIYRSATLQDATKKDVEKIASLGIKTILDIREKKARNEQVGLVEQDPRFEILNFDVNGDGRIPKDYDDGVDSYIEMLSDPVSVRALLRAVLHADKPLLIHCNAGKDRTGVFAGLLLALAGVDFRFVNADYMDSYPLLEKATIRLKRDTPGLLPDVCLNPNIFYLRDVEKRFLDAFGSLEAYMEGLGLNDDEITGLKNVLGIQEKSCGAVIFRNGKVLVEHMAMGHYSLPKGHVEKEDGDDEKATAAREIKEELGLDVSFIPGFRVSTDYSPFPGKFKRVIWFAAYAKEGDIHPQIEEVQDAYWLSPADAMRVLSHKDDRSVLKKASYFEAGLTQNK